MLYTLFYALYAFIFLRLPYILSAQYPSGSYSPLFEKQLVEENLDDGYWIEAFQPDNQTPVGLVAFGLARGEISFYSNPYLTRDKIKPVRLQKLITPNGMGQADISGDGFQDVIISFDYGNTIIDFNPDGGQLVWLENPGKNISIAPWKIHYVGRSPTMHRLKVGHFTQTKRWEIIGLPIVNGPFDVPVPVILFRQPDNVLTATAWDYEIIDQKFFHLIHDAKVFKNDSLDQLVIASREGLTWLYYNKNSQKWYLENIAKGEQGEKQQTNYYGSNTVDIGTVGNDTFAYMAAIEPFHGNVVAVYTKVTNNALRQIQWQRHVLDVYGHPNQYGEGSGHYLVCADFDKDGNDEFLVALRGPAPHEGVFYYKPIDLSRGLFTKWKVSDDSAARIAIADFDNDTFLDFATIGYYVRGYYQAKNPMISVFYNRFASKSLEVTSQLQVIRQNNELVFTVPRIRNILDYQETPFLTVGGITLSLVVLPPYSSRQVEKNTYIKVLAGTIIWVDSSNQSHRAVNHSRTVFCEPKSVCTLKIHSDDKRIKTENEGAIFMVLQTTNDMDDVPRFEDIKKIMIENSLPQTYSEETRKLNFKFIRVDELEWGKEKFKGLEFYNMKGFSVQFADNNENLCYFQLWAAGTGTNAGLHNHNTDRFCEIHTCIVNGNGNSGMHYFRSSDISYDPLTTSDDELIKQVIPPFHEQGPLWDIDANKEPVLRYDGTVLYPWHKWQSGHVNVSESLCDKKSFHDKSTSNNAGTQSMTRSLSKLIPKWRDCNSTSKQAFDIWIVFEFDIKMSKLP